MLEEALKHSQTLHPNCPSVSFKNHTPVKRNHSKNELLCDRGREENRGGGKVKGTEREGRQVQRAKKKKSMKKKGSGN